MKRILLTCCLLASAAVVVLVWLQAADRSRPAPAAPPAADTPPAAGGRWAEGVGYVEPRGELRRLTFKTGGVITHCGPAPGDPVRGGELIAELDTAAVKAAAEVARRRLDLARAKLIDLQAGEHPRLIAVCERAVGRLREQARYLRSEADRLEKLTGSASDTERTKAVTLAVQGEAAALEKEAELLYLKERVRPEQVAVAEAEVKRAEAEVAEADQRLADARLTAPFDGVVLRYLKRSGEGVGPLMPPEPVVLFGDVSRLRVRAEIDERHAYALTPGQPAEVYGRNLVGKTLRGRVVEVERAMGDRTMFTQSATERKDLHAVQVIVELDEPLTAPVGLRVDVRIRTE
jgi:HlyD family secretion protein